MISLYADENAPTIQQCGIVYRLQTPHPIYREGVNISIHVDDMGFINEIVGWFAGKLVRSMTHDEQLEVYKYLVEWELAALRAIGPEDYDYFATKKLSSEYGLDW